MAGVAAMPRETQLEDLTHVTTLAELARHNCRSAYLPRGCKDSLVSDSLRGRKGRMSKPVVVLFVLAMVGVVVAVDLLFFRDKSWFWERLAANVGIVLVFGAFYFRFPGSS
jgi:hypothetical protein